MGKLVHVPAHELGCPVDRLDAGTAALLETLLELRLRQVIQDEPSPSLRILEVEPDYWGLAPGRDVSSFPQGPLAGLGLSHGASSGAPY